MGISIDQIRSQFPMYGDMNDDQLLIAIRKKFYPDMKPADFYKNVDYKAPDPTEGMSAFQKFQAGWGKSVNDLLQGAGQWVGAVDGKDVAESRRLDKALTNTTAGAAGNLAGNVSNFLPTAFIPGVNLVRGAAAVGAGTGALQPSENFGETLKNTGAGALLGPLGLLLGRGASAAYQGGKALLEPFTKGGQEAIAARTLQQFASNPQAAAASLKGATQLVPGSAPTMAQASGDAGLSQLERTLANNPETGPLLADIYAQQRAARLAAVQGLAGDGAKRDAAVTARQAAAGPLYQKATSQTLPVDQTLENLLQRPVVQQAMQRAERLSANQGQPGPLTAGVNGAPATITGKGLQDLKMAMDDMLSDPLAGIGKNEANAVKQVRADLLSWMESKVPEFKQARDTFASKSVPINTMDVADALMQKIEPALARYGASTKEHADAYAKALEAAKETVKKQTGINKPMNEVIDKQAAKLLDDIAKDLARKVNAENLGRATGSNTAQNLAAQNLLRRTLGPTGLPQSWSESTMLQSLLMPYSAATRMTGSQNAVMERLAQAAANPTDAAGLLTMAAKQGNGGLLGPTSSRLFPALSGGLLGTYLD